MTETITKADIIDHLHNELGLNKSECKILIEDFFDEIKASLISSKELSDVELDKISKDLSTSMGSSIIFDYKVDKELIGGLKLQLGSFMIDTSIKNKLKKFEQKMLED